MFDSLDPTTDQTPLTKAMMTAEIILNLLDPLGPSGPSGTSGVGTTGPSPQAGPLGESSPRSGARRGGRSALRKRNYFVVWWVSHLTRYLPLRDSPHDLKGHRISYPEAGLNLL